MSDDDIEFTRRKVLGAAGAVGAAGALGGAGTMAVFSDEENSTGNALTAGELDLEIDWTKSYDGSAEDSYSDVEQELTSNPGPIFELGDVKPGDSGEATISLHNFDNPAWIHMAGEITENAENGMTEPEAVAENGGQVQQVSTTQTDKPANGPDPDGDNDITIDNGSYEITFGELASGSNPGTDWFFTFPDGTEVDTLYREFYGFQDGDGPVATSLSDMTVTSTYPSTGTPGNTYTATVEFDLGSTTLSVDRNVTLDPSLADVQVDYDIENTGSGTIDDLKFYQYVDYDIGSPGGEVGNYFSDSDRDCEFLWQFERDVSGTGNDLYTGFTADTSSDNHHIGTYSSTDVIENGGPFNNDDQHPDSGTTDVDFIMQWSLGGLQSGGTTTHSTTFITDTSQEAFQDRLCAASGGTSGEGELADELVADVWYDGADPDGGNNELEDGETIIASGTLNEVMTQLSDGELLNDQTDTGDKECFPNSTTQYIGFEWNLPIEVGNEVQSDSVMFDLKFHAQQCRHVDDPTNPYSNN